MNVLRHIVPVILLVPACALSLSTASAATITSPIAVTATVASFCTISASPLPFGTYASTALAGTTSVVSTCTNGISYNVGLDVGTGSGATTAIRKMTFNTNTLSYGLYSDAAHTAPIGTTVGTNTVLLTATGAAQTTTVYGLIPAGQYPVAGNYSDTVTASVVY